MPRLIEHISIGFCSGYGDGDYRISTSIEKFSRKQMDELLLAHFHAGRMAWDMWSRAQAQPEASKADSGA